MKSKRGRMIFFIIFIWAILIGGAFTFYFTFRVEPLQDKMRVELGDRVSDDPADYITGIEWVIPRSVVDTSNVNSEKPGTYEVTIKHGWQTFVCEIELEDTTAPTLKLKKGDIYLQKGVGYAVGDFVRKVKDASGDVTVKTEQGEEEVCFSACGVYTVELVAEDPSGNKTEKSLDVTVDTAPSFGDFPEYYIAVGSDIDFLQHITAQDEVDGDVTEDIVMDLSRLDLTKTGIGEIIYSVTDSYGLTASAAMPVRVYDPLELQELINTHRINRFDQEIVGAYNVYDAGYFEEDDVTVALEELEPAIVRLRKDYSDGYSFGSGYIMEITEEDIYICTNRHVVGDYTGIDVYFHDGTKARSEVVDRSESTKAEKDVAVVRVKRGDLDEELFQTLRTIHINRGYWDSLGNTEDIAVGVRCVQENGSVWVDKTGVMLHKEVQPEKFESEGVLVEVDVALRNGMSGSAIVDGHGNLIGMAVCITRVNGKYRYWGVTLPNILTEYEEIMGYSPCYY